MKIYLLNPPLSVRSITADLVWMNFNTYCPEYDWIEPIIDWDRYDSVEQVVNTIMFEKPQVLCISTYTWNHLLCFEVSKRIKAIDSNIVVIMGGPHQGYDRKFFDKHPYIDYLCYATSHGELFLKEALAQIKIHGKITEPELVPFLISRDYEAKNLKAKFNWDGKSAIENNIPYLSKVVAVSKSKNLASVINYETTRGCPYECTYCEWGGGVSSKVTQKPLDTVLLDIDICASLGFTEFGITDANFGILSRDETILKHIAEARKQFKSLDSFVMYGIAKTKIEKRVRILDILFDNKLCDYYFMALQVYDEQVIKNVKRTDITFEENIDLARKYKEKYDIDVKVELIMGLPGYTLDTFYKEMDLYREFRSWFWPRNLFTLLPDSEASSRLYRSLHKIQTSIVGTMDNEEQDITYSCKNVLGKYRSGVEVVTSCESYTTEDWKQMYFMNRAQKILGPLVPIDELPSKFLREQYDKIKVKDWFIPIEKHLDDLVKGMLYNSDISLIGELTIEDIVEKNAQDI